jgi:hypothetical protein
LEEQEEYSKGTGNRGPGRRHNTENQRLELASLLKQANYIQCSENTGLKKTGWEKIQI